MTLKCFLDKCRRQSYQSHKDYFPVTKHFLINLTTLRLSKNSFYYIKNKCYAAPHCGEC
jgi:hypothetical protein